MEWIFIFAAFVLALGAGITGTYLLLRPRMIATQELDAKTAQENAEIRSENIRLLAESSSLENINLTLSKQNERLRQDNESATNHLNDLNENLNKLAASDLKNVSNEALATSKNTEKQVNQSIAFSQKEHEAISANADKMLVLRQKIQMIAELILELSEHTQQIGNTISVVDDIAEQTNMLALNAAVEAARAGEHGKGVVGGFGHLLGHGAGGDGKIGFAGDLTVFHDVADHIENIVNGDGKTQTFNIRTGRLGYNDAD